MITLPGGLSPLQTLPPPDLSNLSDKNPLATGGGPLTSGTMSSPIDFGQSGGGGTDLASLLSQSGGNPQQAVSSAIDQTLAQLISALISSLMPLLQQLAGQQNGGQQNAQGTGGGAPQNLFASPDGGQSGGMPNGPADGATSPTGGATHPTGGITSPTGGATHPTGGITSPTGGATHPVSGAGQNLAAPSGGSGLHLPEALKPYEGAIQNAAQKTGVPGEILAAQIWQESRGNLGAATVNGGNGLQDSGLMQVNSNTFADLQSKNPDLLGPNANANHPADNIMAGALYMKEQLNNFDGNMGAALRAYNSGPLNVNVNDLSDISKTGTGDATYVNKVMNFASTISSGQGTLPA